MGCDSESQWPRGSKLTADGEETFRGLLASLETAEENNVARAFLSDEAQIASMSIEKRVKHGMGSFALEVQYGVDDVNAAIIESFRSGATEADWTDDKLWRLMRKEILKRFEDFDARGAREIELANMPADKLAVGG